MQVDLLMRQRDRAAELQAKLHGRDRRGRRHMRAAGVFPQHSGPTVRSRPRKFTTTHHTR